MTETRVFTLSDIGEGLTEAEVTGWRVAVGDEVRINQIVVDIETAKVAVELPSPFAGTVVELHAAVGDVVRVGAPLVSVAVQGAKDAAVAPAAPQGAQHAPAAAPSAPSVLVGSGPREHGVARRARRSSIAAPSDSPRVAAVPAARVRATELGIDLSAIAPSTPGLALTVADVERAHALATKPPDDPEGATRTPIHGVRRMTAEAMSRSAFTAPHVAEWVSADVTELMARLDAVRREPEAHGIPITPLVFVARALIASALKHPDINASWDAERREIVHFRDVNLGIACATPRGLIVPNVRAAQRLPFFELAGAITGLVHRARAGNTGLDEVRHGTISLTNIGSFGVDGGVPILNPGEAAILCMGQIREQPWVVNHELAVRSVLTLTLCFDHRLVDGALGSRVLRDVANALEESDALLGGSL